MKLPRTLEGLLLGTCFSLMLSACAGHKDGHPGDGYGGEGHPGGDIGAPCELEEDCESGLICDFHGKRGSCQKPHHH